MKKLICLIFLLMSCIQPLPVFAQEDEYIVFDYLSGEEIGASSSLKQARALFTKNTQNYSELVIKYKDKIIEMEMGIVSLPTSACDTNFEFTNTETKESGYTNGCYGADALYLGTSESGKNIEFYLSGVRGSGSLDQVSLIPFSEVSQMSSYILREGRLYHQVKSNLSSDKYASLIDLGKAPNYLSDGETYLSYDGHYFYSVDSFEAMSEDVRNQEWSHSINFDNPYYNYYQYVSHRTMTQVTSQKVVDYFEGELLISSSISAYNDQDKDSSHDVLTQSQYFGNESVFFEYQNLFGANALMMMALSMNESASGRSSLSYTRNNLFGHAAYDSDVEKNAKRYLAVSNSVYSHAKNYISGSYLNPNKFQYHGGYFGNKASGMNVSYASDPYWGEKAAQFYIRLDEALGSLDYNSQCLAIKQGNTNLVIRDAEGKKIAESGKSSSMSFVVLEELTDTYKIQLDEAIYPIEGNSVENTYSIQNNVGYIQKRDIDFLINKDQIHDNKILPIYFKANGGCFSEGATTLVLEVKEGALPVCEEPVKENAVFIGWDKELEEATSITVYTAIYKEINSIEMENIPNTILEYNDRINIEKGSIIVNYEDGTRESIPLTSSMISGYDTKEEGQQTVTVTYGGARTSYPLTVVMELDTLRNNLTEEINFLVNEWGDKAEFSEDEIIRLTTLKENMIEGLFPFSSFSTIRTLDQIYRCAAKNSLIPIIEKNPVHLAISGLYTTVQSKTLFTKAWIKDTIRISYSKDVDFEQNSELEKVAKANGYRVVDSFIINGKLNFDELQLEDYILVTCDLPSSLSSNDVVSVLAYDEGDVVKLATQQSATTLTFKTKKLSEYMIVSRSTTNTYQGQAPVETNSYENNGFNIYAFMNTVPWLVLGILFILVLLVLAAKKRLFLMKKRGIKRQNLKKYKNRV